MGRAKRNILAVLLWLMALAVAAFAIFLTARFPGTEARLLTETEDPMVTAEAFLNALCAGDYATAGSHLQGNPDLGLDTLPEEEIPRLLNEAFRQSWRWSPGLLWHKGSEARLPISFTALDLTKLTADLNGDVLASLALRLDSAQRLEELYNEDNTWREDAVLQATEDVLRRRLRHEEEYLSTTQLTLLLRYENRRWLIVPDEMLYEVLAGEVGE